MTPLEYSKLWVKNFDEIKKIAKVEGTEKKVQLVYCLPEVDIDKMNSSILDCLMEGADELIDYRDDEKVMSFIEKTYKVAHA